MRGTVRKQGLKRRCFPAKPQRRKGSRNDLASLRLGGRKIRLCLLNVGASAKTHDSLLLSQLLTPPY